MIREVLEVFIRVCIFLDQPIFLSFVFSAISSRLDYVSNACGPFAVKSCCLDKSRLHRSGIDTANIAIRFGLLLPFLDSIKRLYYFSFSFLCLSKLDMPLRVACALVLSFVV